MRVGTQIANSSCETKLRYAVLSVAPEHTTHIIGMEKANSHLNLTPDFFFVAFVAFDGEFFRVRVVLHLFAFRTVSPFQSRRRTGRAARHAWGDSRI